LRRHKMKAGIFDPYLDTMGGGERYCLTLAEALLAKGWQVDVFWPTKEILPKLQDKFQLKIEKINFVDYAPWRKTLCQRWQFEKNYDLLFYLSDGSVPFMFGRKNWLHFQVPFKSLHRSFLNQVKLGRINQVIVNSIFTKKVVDRGLGISSKVIYPPVDIVPLKPLQKENLILSVGRFSQLLQKKRHDVLVEVFKNLIDGCHLKGWRLILAGGSEVGGGAFAAELRRKAEGYPIEIRENPSFEELVKLYGKAKIFWTASGYEIDEEREPARVEHFGMTTVEAMASGAIPIVQGKGGQKEIVEENKNGFWWQEKSELITKTLELIKNFRELSRLAKEAQMRSQDFAKEKFYEKVYDLLSRGD